MYGKIVNGVLVYAPDNYVRNDGSVISNFNQDEDAMLQYGYRYIIEDIPAGYDSKTQELYISSYTTTTTNLYITYGVVSKNSGGETVISKNFIDDNSISKTTTYSSFYINGNFIRKSQAPNYDDSEIKTRLDNLEANSASITDLYVQNEKVERLEASYANIKDLNTDDLTAMKAQITDLDAKYANITDADIENLNVLKEHVVQLDADYSNINTLVNGNLTSDNIQSMIISGDKFTVENGFIKNAMIESISVDKILAGNINTNIIGLTSEDGSLTINGSLEQFKDSDGNVRIQIGKNAQGNFTFILYGKDGKGTLIDENGVKASAISDGLIVDKMVADNANIDGKKVNIESFINEINNDENTVTIKSNKINIDSANSTLDVVYNTLKNTTDDLKSTTASHTTEIKAVQDNISTLISDTTIEGENGKTTKIKDAYSSLQETVNGISSTVGEHTTNLNNLTGEVTDVKSKQTKFTEDLSGFETRVENVESTSSTNSTDISNMKQTIEGISTSVSSVKDNVSATVNKIEVLYYLSDSETELTGGSWSTTAPSWSADKFMWSKTKTYYTDETKQPTESLPVCLSGVNGSDGETYYTWIKYADDNKGTGLSNDPTNKAYIGFAYNKITATESTNANDYTWSLIKGDKGDKGDDGVQGEPGEDGKTYYTWIKYSDNSNGNPCYDTPKSTTKYIGIAVNKIDISESEDYTQYTWSQFKGDQGVVGKTGADGKTLYTWIKYANDAIGTGLSDNPTGKTYIGLAYNKTTATESTTASDYTWSLIKGEQGLQGVKGDTGADGKTLYTWIKYANDINGNGISNDPTGKLYIGFAYNKETATESNIASDYTWSLIKGDKGDTGVPGATYYTWIKYSDNANGNPCYDTPKSTTQYIGIATNKTSSIESDDNTQYTWSLFKGIKGDQGVPGKDGTSVTILGNYNSLTELNEAHSTNNTKGDGYIVGQDLYVWQGTKFINVGQIKGQDGVSIIWKGTLTTAPLNPTNGWAYYNSANKKSYIYQDNVWDVMTIDGTTTYTWIKYANDNKGGGLSDDPTGKTYIGFAYNKNSETESNVASDYTWSLIKGEKGDTGVAGTTYYTWIKYSDNANGNPCYDTPKSTTKYIGIVTNQTSSTESTDYTKYTWSQFRGNDGSQGVPGQAGADGKTYYTWIKYADDAKGTNLSDDPSGKLYIGFAYNKTTETESITASDYTWSLIRGEKGDTGVQGVPGVDGKTYYTWIKYSDNANGSSCYDTPKSTTKYIGIAVNQTSATESTDYTKYTWSQFRGNDGSQGVPGKDGTNGTTTYTWIKYATSSSGANLSDDPTNKTYIGFAYNKTTKTESTTASDYTWSLIKGEKGDTGVAGTTYYTWIKYSDNSDGASLYDTPKSTTKYIGIAVNQTSSTESTDKTKYTWSQFKGDTGSQGIQGVPGQAGADGKTYYTWIKYATSSSGANLSDDPSGKTYIGLAYNKTTATESTNASDYTWSLIKGEKGDTGVAGKTYYTWIKYSDNSDGASLYDTPKSTTKYIGIAVNQTSATESTDKTKYTWSQFKGDKGDTGATGQSVTNVSPQWYLSTSNTTQSGGSWLDEMPDIPSDKYIWTRSKVTLANPTATKYTTPILDKNAEISKQTIAKTADFSQTIEGFKTRVSAVETIANNASDTASTTADSLSKNYSTTTDMNTAINQKADSITSSVSKTYQTKSDMSNYSTTTQMNSAISTKADSITSSVSNTYQTKSDMSNYATTNALSTVTQTANKINWLIANGTESSNMTLTSDAYKVIANNITLTASHINLNGYVSNDSSNWSINNEGNITAKNLNIDGYLSTNQLRVGNIECSNLPSKVMGTSIIYVDDTVSNDNAVFTDGAHYNSLQGAIDAIPQLLDSYDVYISLQKDIHEDIDIRGFAGGRIVLYFCSHTIYGSMFVRDNNCRIAIYGGSDANSTTNHGCLKPSNPINTVSCGISFVCESTTFCNLYYVDVYGKTDSSNNKFYYGVCCYDGANLYFNNGKIVGCDNAFRANSLGNLYVGGSTGCVNGYVFYATSGATIRVNNSTQCNSTSSTKTYNSTPSSLIMSSSFSKWDTGSSVGSNDNTTTATKNVTYYSTLGDTYRTTTYVGWKKDNTVRQGNYGYGNCNGLWFFDNQFGAVQGKTITKVTIKIIRQSGGVYGDVTHTLKAHGYTSRPSGAPSYTSGYSQTFSLPVDDSITVTITNSTVLTGISNGTIKGFGLQSSYDSSHYSVCSGNATVSITYK